VRAPVDAAAQQQQQQQQQQELLLSVGTLAFTYKDSSTQVGMVSAWCLLMVLSERHGMVYAIRE